MTNLPTILFFSGAIIGIFMDKVSFLQTPRRQHGTTAFIALLMFIAMAISGVRLYNHPDPSKFGEAFGFFAIGLFILLSGFSMAINGYKAITGRTERLGFWGQ